MRYDNFKFIQINIKHLLYTRFYTEMKLKFKLIEQPWMKYQMLTWPLLLVYNHNLIRLLVCSKYNEFGLTG